MMSPNGGDRSSCDRQKSRKVFRITKNKRGVFLCIPIVRILPIAIGLGVLLPISAIAQTKPCPAGQPLNHSQVGLVRSGMSVATLKQKIGNPSCTRQSPERLIYAAPSKQVLIIFVKNGQVDSWQLVQPAG